MRERSQVSLLSCAPAQGLYALLLGGLAAGALLPGCGAAYDGEGTEEWGGAEGEIGQLEQELIRQATFNRDVGTLELDPEPPPPPPPPPPEPDTCSSDAVGEVISAIGLRALTYFGRVDPGIWECVPGSIDCASVRLSSALRNQAMTPAEFERVAEMDELIAMLTEQGGMARFAAAYRDQEAACIEKGCPRERFAFDFVRGEPDECGNVRVTISLRRRFADVIGTQPEVLAPASSAPRSGSTGTRPPLAGGGSFQVFGSAKLATQLTSATSAPSTSTNGGSTVGTTSVSAAPVLGPFYGLYGHDSDCDPADGVTCNGNETDTVVKTYLDHTCEGSSTSAEDLCHNPQFDAANFYHDMIGAAVAVNERRNEKCYYWPTANHKAQNSSRAIGSITKRTSASRLLQCIVPR